MLVLPDQSSVDLFASSVQLSVGSELGLSLGPLGRSVETSIHVGDQGSSGGIFSYSYSKGMQTLHVKK
jgi:lipid-binding SYLF domain-containing protein